MAIATNAQVQKFVDTRLRPRAEQFRALLLATMDDKASNGDVYEACSQPSPTWTDQRTDGPPRLLIPGDVLTFDTICALFPKLIAGTMTSNEVTEFKNNWAIFQSACVRPVGG